MYSAVMRREYGVNIIVKKGKYRATFTVPQNRWKYFFKDRIDALTPGGKKIPIYHAVVAHKRQTKTKLTYVKTHYRGSRHFWWQGYEINIVMQGLHSVPQADFAVSALDEFPPDRPETDFIDATGVGGGRINRLFEGV